MHLNDIHSPADVKKLDDQELKDLSVQLRERIIREVSRNGGHLASNLGVVELTIALHRVFDFPKDRLVFDVGHQCYAHKLLTGRQEKFVTLRQFDGMAGFPRREESEYDAFGAGHASTAISAAVGFARARDLKHEDRQVIAVLGDGALTGGMCYEALNDAGSSNLRMIVVLNDNGMSISPNVGAMSGYLTRMRAGKGWFGAKHAVSHFLKRIPVVGKPLHHAIQRVKNTVRSIFVQDRFFDSLGFHYLGPVDGNDIYGLEKLFNKAKELDEPVLIHVVTKKGKGYERAENEPTLLHGTPPFDLDTGSPLAFGGASMSRAAGDELCRLAAKDERVVAITAAMTESTGLGAFAQRFPKRLFDVGIAEEHAVTMAAGLAAGGVRPFVAIYDTFLQRAYDQIMHDVCLQKLPVVFLIDRAGLSEDGATHQGVYGMGYLSQLPGMTVLNASSRAELRAMERYALTCEGPVAIRYAKSDVGGVEETLDDVYTPAWKRLREGADAALLATGGEVHEALKAAEMLKNEGIDCAVYNASCICPLDENMLKMLHATPVVTIEEGIARGGFGSSVAQWCAQNAPNMKVRSIAITGACTTQGDHQMQLAAHGLNAKAIAGQVLAWQKEWKE